MKKETKRGIVTVFTAASILLSGCSLVREPIPGTPVKVPKDALVETVANTEPSESEHFFAQPSESKPVPSSEKPEPSEAEPSVEPSESETMPSVEPTESTPAPSSENPEPSAAPESSEAPTETVSNLNINPEFYNILDAKGYNLNMFPSFSSDILNYRYEMCNSNIWYTTTGVNFRLGPGTEYGIISTLVTSSSVELVAKCNNGWYLVKQNNTLGFIRGDLLSSEKIEQPPAQSPELPSAEKVVRATTDVNIRSECSTENTPLGLLRKDSCLPMIRKLDNGWYEVEYQGTSAYVHGDYVVESYALTGQCSSIVSLTADTTLLSAPAGSAITTYPQYEIAKVYGEESGYYYVEIEGRVGYIPKSNCSALSGTYVVVDISSQKLYLYSGTQVLYTSSVVTGKDDTPSDIGRFTIKGKSQNATLTGPGYSVDVVYWMPYNGGEGLHDAPWRNYFGGDIYHNSGSHGCVNMPDEAAKTVYENMSVGGTVLVKK